MTVTFRSAFAQLVYGVRDYLAMSGVTTFVGCGFRELPKQNNQGTGRGNRIVFLPAAENGDAGRIVPVRGPGTRSIYDLDDPSLEVAQVRSLGDWDRKIVVSVWAFNADSPRDELVQTASVEDLFEWTKRAVDRVGQGNVAWGAVRYVETKENTFGIEMRAELTFSSPIYDTPLEVATPGFEISKE